MKGLDLPGLLVCRSLLDDEAVRLFLRLDSKESPEAYELAALLMATAERLGLSGNLLRAYFAYKLTYDSNPVSQAEMSCGRIGPSLGEAFAGDMEKLLPLWQMRPSECLPTTLLDDYRPTRADGNAALAELLAKLEKAASAAEAAEAFRAYYHSYGYGDIAAYRAFRWDGGRLCGIHHFEEFRMADIVGYEHQKEQLIGNTLAFLDGKPANNVLLTGARGTGKSSGVKALANEYYGRGLRLLQITKPQLASLPEIMETLRQFAGKRFIIFLDDLSFEESDAEYKDLKSAIDGGVEALPENVLLYATSNRRHLIRESWRDRSEAKDEIYRDDSLNETISLSDRFGLIIHYFTPSQQEYLDIIAHMLKKEGIVLPPEELRLAGVRWEMTHSGRSGRTAQQFVKYHLGQR